MTDGRGHRREGKKMGSFGCQVSAAQKQQLEDRRHRAEGERVGVDRNCGIDACGIMAHVQNGRMIKVEPAEFPDPRYRQICLRGRSSLDITYHPDRLQNPMKRIGSQCHLDA